MIRHRTSSAAARIAIGSVAGQGMALAFIPLVSRLYSPSNLGLFATCLAVASTLGAVVTLRIDRALTLPEDDVDAAIFAYGAIVCAISIPMAGMAAFFSVQLLVGFQIQSLWWTVAPLTSAIGCGTVLLQYAVRRRNYSSVALRNAIQPMVQAVAQVGFGLALGGYGALLVIAAILGRLAGLTNLAREVLRAMGGVRIDAGRRVFISLVRRYQRVIYLGTLAGFVNTVALQAVIPLVAIVYGSHAAGLFSMSQMLFVSPFILLGSAIGQVFLGEFSFAVRENSPRAPALFRRASTALFFLAIGAGVAILLLSSAVPHVLGDRWADSGYFGILLIPLVTTRLISAPLAQTLIVMERQGTQLALDSVRIVGILGVFFMASSGGLSLSVAISTYALWCSITYIGQWNLCRRAIRPNPTPA